MKRCFVVHPADNVATLLDDAAAEQIMVIQAAGGENTLALNQPIALGHKTALHAIQPDEPILKFGIPIGQATQPIQPGDWVHLHNCASFVDSRSATLDIQTGRPGDTPYE